MGVCQGGGWVWIEPYSDEMRAVEEGYASPDGGGTYTYILGGPSARPTPAAWRPSSSASLCPGVPYSHERN